MADEQYAGSLTEMVCDVANELPLTIRRRFYGLKGITGMRETISRYNLDLGTLQKKYEVLFRDLHLRRAAVVSGKDEPSASDVRAGMEFDFARNTKRNEKEKAPAPPVPAAADTVADATSTRGVPNFWMGALQNHPDFTEMISDRDCEVLVHLSDVREELFPNPFHGFRLYFEFDEGVGEFFTERVIVKSYHTKEVEYDTVFVKAEGTPITWKDKEKNVTILLQKRKQRNRRGGATRTVVKEVPCDSFFNFFTPPKRPTAQSIAEAVAGGGGDDDGDEMCVQDYELGCLFRDEIVPCAVDWYTGYAAYDQGYDDSQEDGDEEEEDEGFEDVADD